MGVRQPRKVPKSLLRQTRYASASQGMPHRDEDERLLSDGLLWLILWNSCLSDKIPSRTSGYPIASSLFQPSAAFPSLESRKASSQMINLLSASLINCLLPSRTSVYLMHNLNQDAVVETAPWLDRTWDHRQRINPKCHCACWRIYRREHPHTDRPKT